MKRFLVPLAIGVAVLYAVLAFGAASCHFLHAENSPHTHHHNKSHVAHSVLCAWACQVNPTVMLMTVVPFAAALALVSLLPLFIIALHSRCASAVPLSRGPPPAAR